MTPLHIAVDCNQLEVAKYLLFHTNVDTSIEDKVQLFFGIDVIAIRVVY